MAAAAEGTSVRVAAVETPEERQQPRHGGIDLLRYLVADLARHAVDLAPRGMDLTRNHLGTLSSLLKPKPRVRFYSSFMTTENDPCTDALDRLVAPHEDGQAPVTVDVHADHQAMVDAGKTLF